MNNEKHIHFNDSYKEDAKISSDMHRVKEALKQDHVAILKRIDHIENLLDEIIEKLDR